MKEVYYCIRNKQEINPIMEKYFQTEGHGDVVIVALKDTSLESLVIPYEIDGNEVTEIGEEAFVYSSLKEITLPNSILCIKDNAFPRGVKINYQGKEYDEFSIYYAVKKRYQEILNEQIDGVIEAVYQQDKLLGIVRTCKTMSEVYEKLEEAFGLSELQSDTVLGIPLQILQSLDVDQLESLKVSFDE